MKTPLLEYVINQKIKPNTGKYKLEIYQHIQRENTYYILLPQGHIYLYNELVKNLETNINNSLVDTITHDENVNVYMRPVYKKSTNEYGIRYARFRKSGAKNSHMKFINKTISENDFNVDYWHKQGWKTDEA